MRAKEQCYMGRKRGNGGRAEEQASNLQLVVVLQHFVHVVLRAREYEHGGNME